jgi:hypothetical protein
MSEGYHLEIDVTPMCNEEDVSKYTSIIGFCICRIVLGRFDIAYATSALSRFIMLPRECYLKAAKRILAYLKTFPKGRIIVDTTYTNHSSYRIEDHPNWKGFYLDDKEEITNDLPKSKRPKIRLDDCLSF